MDKKTSKKFAHGVVHGRFQPPHNGHIRYILAALDASDFVTIGISTPKICTKEEAERTGYPCTAELNPFTFSERAEMIALALTEAGVEKKHYECVSFPSDYTAIETLLPKDAVFLMSVTSASDQKKIDYLKSLGYGAEVLMSVPETDSRERSGIVRGAAGTDETAWEDTVPKSVAEYLKKHDLFKKLGSQN